MSKENSAIPNHCSFCDKSREQAAKLIVNGGHAICDECVKFCGNLLTGKLMADVKKHNKKSLRHTNPIKIKEHLDTRVVGQDQAKMTISVAVANHYKRIFFKNSVQVDKSNVLLLGPTGSGKTLLAQTVAKFLDVPFVIADVTGLTEAGYVGGDVDSIISRLLAAADGDVEKAQQGIIFLDEVDKISKKGEAGGANRDIGGEGVQQNLLKMVEGTVLTIPTEGSRKHPGMSQVDIDTSNILFIASGAFVGLAEQMLRRRSNAMGFDHKPSVQTTSVEVMPEDLIKFGLIPEFIGRFPVLVSTQALTEPELIRVLTQPDHNLINQFEFYFNVDGVDMCFTPEALTIIAKRAVTMKTGARALRGILEQYLMPHLFSLPKYKQERVSRLTFTAEVLTEQKLPVFEYKTKITKKVLTSK